MDHAIHLIIYVIMTLASLVMAVIGFIDGILAAAMSAAGIPPDIQIILLAVAAIILVVAAVRALGGLFATLIIVLLLLLLVHRVFPHMQVPHGHVPSWLSPPAQPQK